MTANPADSGLDQAAALRLQGRLPEALALAAAAASADPESARARALHAVCLAETGDIESARREIDAALANPLRPALALVYASTVAEIAGDAEAALKHAQTAVMAPDAGFEAYGRLGDVAGRLGEFDTARKALTRALSLNPRHDGVRLLHAGACLVTGDADGARESLAALSPPARISPQALHIDMALSHRVGDWARMAACGEKLVEQQPGDEEAIGGLAYALGRQGYYNKASRLYRPLVEHDPANAEKWAALGRLRLGARDIEDARRCFETALERDPECAEASFGMARLLTFTGDLDAAAEMCRRTLAKDPDHLEAFGQLSEVASGRLSDEELSRLKALTRDETRAADQRAIGLFALGDALHKRKQAEAAFDAWAGANALRVAMRSPTRPGYDPAEHTARIDQLERLFARPVDVPAPDDGAPTPIFIVGMPRSGTTLLEAAVSAHSAVSAGGELPLLPFIVEECLDWAKESGWAGGVLPEDKRREWRRRYLAQYDTFKIPPARFVTDKQPSNFLAVGLIRQLFPDAPVLHIRRNPVETGFSIFRRNFSQQWAFADRQEDIAHYYARYGRIMAHWDHAHPGASAFVQYETLVDRFESELRRLLDAAGLGFEPECLEFYRVERPVMTFSAVQVRRPPSPEHKFSTGAYSARLEPLRRALEQAGVDLNTGAPRESRRFTEVRGVF